jgi:hypothetical protein
VPHAELRWHPVVLMESAMKKDRQTKGQAPRYQCCLPRLLMTDNGKTFLSKKVSSLPSELGVETRIAGPMNALSGAHRVVAPATERCKCGNSLDQPTAVFDAELHRRVTIRQQQ